VGLNNSEPEAFAEGDVKAMGELAEVLSEGFRRLQDLRNLERRLGDLEREMAERKQLEGQLRQAQKMEAVGELTAGLAHNFNNMLQTVVGSISMAMRQAPSGIRDLLEDAESSAHKAAEMIRHLLVFSRKGIQPLHESQDLTTLLADVVAVVGRTFDRRIAIDFDGPPAPIHVMGDAGQLEQVFLNLCLNARDALETKPFDDPRICISLDSCDMETGDLRGQPEARPGSYGRIVVSDNGVGMDGRTLERIFEPFFTTKAVDRGTGLGLSTVYGIARQHGGWIECDSEPGKGTTFTVYVPQVEAPMAVGSTSLVADPKGGTETVLVIDDEEMVRRTATRMLELYGYRVIQGEGGPHGLEVFERELEAIDLVLLDLSMPEKSGRECLSEMRGLDAEVKVIFFTGYSAETTVSEGVAGVLQKPFTPADLANEVRSVLDSPEPD
jgi:two-component system NtrC family sensor kinase